MSVRPPAAGAQIHFHIARRGRSVTELNHRATKIRTSLGTTETRVKHADGLSVQRHELRALEALVLPDGLKQPLGRCVACVMQTGGQPMAHSPLSVKAGRGRGHLGLLLRLRFPKVKCCDGKIFK
jgi:hypothetical protein